MKKLLVYMHEGDLAPTGGPRGYNYNLLQGFKELGILEKPEDIEISYLPGKSSSLIANNRVNKIKNKYVRNFVKASKSILKKGIMMYGPRHSTAIDLNRYDAIHFHTTIDMYQIKDSLKNYEGKVFLTSHTPTRPSAEIYDMLTDFEKKYMRQFYKKLSRIEEYDFDHADYIVFPCREAEEPYYHEWDGYEEIHARNEKKYLYITTGTEEKKVTIDRDAVREKYGIPENAFVISYVGRHNEIKGYDTLKTIAKRVLEKDDDIYFLIAGQEGPLYHLESDRWIEVGWTKNPGEVIKAADAFILPNKETYFDLVLLEVMSIGQVVLATNTGGNKYFKKFENIGIIFYESVENAVENIENMKGMTSEELENIRQRNKKIYEDNFTNKIFAKNYLQMIRENLK